MAGLLGLGNHSTRKSHYPELAARLDELEQARQHLQQLNDRLEQRVAERTDALLEANHNLQQQIVQRELIEQQLRDARDAAQAANRSKDKYLAAASHDLLQPLNAARLLIATLRERQLPTAEHVLVERTHQALEGPKTCSPTCWIFPGWTRPPSSPTWRRIGWMSCWGRWFQSFNRWPAPQGWSCGCGLATKPC